MYTKSIYLLLLSLLFWTCSESEVQNDALMHVEDSEARKILGKVLDASGGLRHWNNFSSLRYNKYFKLYTETGDIEKDVRQSHKYVYKPKKFIEITSDEGDVFKKLIFDDGNIQEKVNNKVNEETDTKTLMNKLHTSLFVIGLPFKLADPGVDLTYEGKDELEDDTKVHVIKALFDPAANVNHTTQDIWWFYFNKKTYLMEGYLVKHKDHYSYVRNEKTQTKGGFNFPVKRSSWRSDAKRNKLYLRATYDYVSFSFDLK